MRIGFVGLGVMGFPMAGHLASAGQEVTVFNRTRAKAERWAAEHGGAIAATPADAARGAAVIAAISQGAAGSWQMSNRSETMIEGRYDFGFAVDWMRKDLRNTLSEARGSGARLPLTALVDQFYADVQARGGGRLDTSSLRL